mgnify:CR=1 FL=1|tara:strand:+ start:1106 stop:1222 length:117 start_codon:yes stop_codon:yes gene_type:complete
MAIKRPKPEARNETGATLLVLAGGQTVPASAINALREA